MATYFLFDGGNYKRGIDDGRVRVPLTPEEASMVFHDPEVPGIHAPTSIGTVFNMNSYASDLCNLAVGDEIMVGLVPDAAVYRYMWASFNEKFPGLEFTVDLVSVLDVWDEYVTPTGNPVPGAGGSLSLDGNANYIGQATYDAVQLAKLYGDTWGDYRNTTGNGTVVGPVEANPGDGQVIANLGEAYYMRLTVTAVPANYTASDGCCSTCGSDALPTLQVGAIFDSLCVNKQIVKRTCNCSQKLCDEGCENQFESAEGTPPEVTIAGVYDGGNYTITLTATFDQDVTGFDQSDVVTTEPGLPGPTISFNNTSGGPAVYTVVYDVALGDFSGGPVTFQVPAASAVGVVGGLDNTVSNLETVTVPGV